MRSTLARVALVSLTAAALALPAFASGDSQQTPYPTITGEQPQEQHTGQQQARQPQDRARQQQRQDANTQAQMQPPPPEISGKRPVKMVVVASAQQIVSNPNAYYGVPVSVHAGVHQVMGPRVFTLDEEGWLEDVWFDDQLMVLNPNPSSTAGMLGEDNYVTVVGTLRQFIRADLERDYDWFDDVPDYNLELDGRPVIVADSVRTSEGAQLVQNPPTQTQVFVTTPGRIAELPGRYYGRSVSVRAEVEGVVSRKLFTLDEDRLFAGPDVLVFNPFPAVTPDDDEVVTVIGTVRPFVRSEFERDYDWFDAADFGANLDQYERRPVIVAHSIVGERQWVVLQPQFTLERSEETMARRMEERQRQAQAGQQGRTGQAQPGQPTGQPPAQQPQQPPAQQPQQPPAQQPQQPPTQQPQQPPQAERPAGTAGEGPIGDVSALANVSDPTTLANRPVDLQDVQVQGIVDARTIWIGPSMDRRVLVVIPQGTTLPGDLAEGQRLRVQGTVAGREAVPQGVEAPFAIRATTIERRQ